MLGNSNFGIITLTRNLRYELLDKSFSISVLHLINFLISALSSISCGPIMLITKSYGRYVQLRPSAALLSGR